MHIEILNTGSELMLGNTVNTHAAWLGRALFALGLRVSRQTTVPDGPAIHDALAEAVSRADVVIVTGGLGPTSDDMCREIAAEVLGIELMEDEAALRSLESFFAARAKPMAESNRKQALALTGCDILPNPNGTAPGIYVPPRLNRRAHCAVFLLPGPPRELYPMFYAEVSLRLCAFSGRSGPECSVSLKFCGVGESDFHQKIDAALAAITGLEYGYCADIGEVELRLIGDQAAVDAARALAAAAFPDEMISEDGASLPEVIVKLLVEKNAVIALAESCTGGLISQRITQIPGASRVFTHGFVTYSDAAKQSLLGVSPASLAAHGAVSECVAREMARGALEKSGADFAVAITGIAGPGGGTPEKPVGTAWLAISDRTGFSDALRILQPRNRADFQLAASQAALDLLRRRLLRC